MEEGLSCFLLDVVDFMVSGSLSPGAVVLTSDDVVVVACLPRGNEDPDLAEAWYDGRIGC